MLDLIFCYAVVLLTAGHFRAALNGETNGEAIWAAAVVSDIH